MRFDNRFKQLVSFALAIALALVAGVGSAAAATRVQSINEVLGDSFLCDGEDCVSHTVSARQIKDAYTSGEEQDVFRTTEADWCEFKFRCPEDETLECEDLGGICNNIEYADVQNTWLVTLTAQNGERTFTFTPDMPIFTGTYGLRESLNEPGGAYTYRSSIRDEYAPGTATLDTGFGVIVGDSEMTLRRSVFRESGDI